MIEKRTIAGSADLLAVIPHLLGTHPTESFSCSPPARDPLATKKRRLQMSDLHYESQCQTDSVSRHLWIPRSRLRLASQACLFIRFSTSTLNHVDGIEIAAYRTPAAIRIFR